MRLAFAVLLLLASYSAHAAVLRVVVDDIIHPIADEFVGRALDEAARTKAEVVILELRTPGGLDTSMRGIVEKIIRSQVPVIVWVGPSGSRAASRKPRLRM